MNHLSKEYLGEISYPQVFQRGKSLFENGEVTDIEVSEKEVTAKVIGSKVYKTKMTFLQTGEPIFLCTCPYDYGGICKHSVALGLAVINENISLNKISVESDSDKKQHFENIDELIKTASQNQKDEFLKDILSENSLLTTRFKGVYRR